MSYESYLGALGAPLGVSEAGLAAPGRAHLSLVPEPAEPMLTPADDLWQERSIRSVANLTRQDGHEFLALAAQIPVRTTITTYALDQAEQALTDLRAGAFEGSAVIVP